MRKEYFINVFWDIGFPLSLIVLFFWFALWDMQALTWDYRMYMALSVAVFFNFFLRRFIWNSMKRNEDRLILYQLLWEISVPLLVVFMALFSIFKEYKLYNWATVTKANQWAFYILVFLIILFIYLLWRGLRFFNTKIKNNFQL